ncbi:MAG: hypothetical protein EPN36_12715 [Rhodanobacteraceae bacterium]|nr:MAG: hypothetical protein EPN36_12715 [Rhodanobacteraceae bacterium]
MHAVASPLVIGITSHRNLATAEIAPIRARVRAWLMQLQGEFPNSPLTILSPLAEGGDQLVAEEGLKLGARLIAPLPLPHALYARDFADAATRGQFESLCAQAQVIELPLLPGHSADGLHRNGVDRDRQYAQAGMFVARHCHVLLAIWDGKDSSKLGGTAQIVDYYLTGALPSAFDRRRRAPRWLAGGGDERLLCHLVCAREAPDGAPAASLQAGQMIWRTPDATGQPDAPMPPAFRRVFANANEFNLDAAKYREEIAAFHAEIDERHGAQACGTAAGLFAAADWLAVHFQRRVLLGLRIIYTAAALMGIAFTVYDNLPRSDNMLYVFLLLFVVGVVTSFIAKRRAWHRKYLDYRALAEGLRVQCYWRRAGISLTTDPEFAHDSLMQKQDIELGWVRNVMRSAGLSACAHVSSPDAQQVRGVIEDWVGDEEHGELGYYRHRTEQRERTHHINEMIGAICLLAAILISVFMAVFLRQLSYDAKNDLIVIMAVFSIIAAVREAYSFRKADRELIRQYRFMGRVFGDARKALDRTDNLEEQRGILRALGEAALAEHVEWAVMHRERPLEAGRM